MDEFDLSLGSHKAIVDSLESVRQDMKACGIDNPLLAAMVGNPIAQVKAPAMLNPGFEKEGLPVRMVSVELPLEGFEDFYGGLLTYPGVVATVVTVPFKFRAAKFCATLDRSAELAGAVNLMMRAQDGSWAGAMADGDGFLAALKLVGFDPIGRKAYMAGAGGAGCGIAAALLPAGLASMDIYDPDQEKAKRLEEGLGLTRLSEPPGGFAGYDLLINATPLGLKEDDPLPFDPSTAGQTAFLGDVIAQPEWTRLRAAAAQQGMATIGGMDMLKGQIDALYRGVVKAVQDNLKGGDDDVGRV